MRTKANFYHGLTITILLGLTCTAGAITVPLTGVSLGNGAPPGTLGGYAMIPTGTDPSAIGSDVSSIGQINFNQAVRHDQIGNGWGTWSHGYVGNVYDTGSSLDPTTLLLQMVSPVSAFYFFAESVNFGNFSFTATAQDGTTISQIINGNGGASGFGFYATGPDLITSITITTTDGDGFALGEFGVSGALTSVPDGGSSLGYLVVGLACLGAHGFYAARRRKVTT